jgi:hypothetical protein
MKQVFGVLARALAAATWRRGLRGPIKLSSVPIERRVRRALQQTSASDDLGRRTDAGNMKRVALPHYGSPLILPSVAARATATTRQRRIAATVS